MSRHARARPRASTSPIAASRTASAWARNRTASPTRATACSSDSAQVARLAAARTAARASDNPDATGWIGNSLTPPTYDEGLAFLDREALAHKTFRKNFYVSFASRRSRHGRECLARSKTVGSTTTT